MIKKTILLAMIAVSGMFASHAIAEEVQQSTIYEIPTMKTLSKLYWNLDKLSLDNAKHINNFLLINECDLYRTYFQNEFEWENILKSTRDLLEKRKDTFSTRFKVIQPLRLAEYDTETSTFDIWDPYKIESAIRFEILSDDVDEETCDVSYRYNIEGYPKGIYAELNRPVTLKNLKVAPEDAQRFIKNKIKNIEKTGANITKREDTYKYRDAYLVMKIRVFSYKEDVRVRDGQRLAKVLAVLESYEIYGDRDQTQLLAKEEFKRKKKRSAYEIELKKRYQEKLKQRKLEEKKAREAEAQKKEAAQ